MKFEQKYKDEDLIGKKFGRLIVKSIYRKNKIKYACCKCDCGNEKDVIIYNLLKKHTTSCGCFNKEKITKHGLVKHILYQRWKSMIQRCTNPKDISYKNYGARGIKVCSQWLGMSGLKNYITFCINNGWRKGLTVDRIDNDGDYEPNNIRFVEYHIQGINQRISSKNTSGYRGVTYNKRNDKWRSNIRVRNNRVYFGDFNTKKEAVEARNKFIIDHNLTEYPIQEWRGEE